MSNLHPEQRADKDGKIVTRHVRSDAPVASPGRGTGIAAPRAAQATSDAGYSGQDFDTLQEFIDNPSEEDYEKAIKSVIVDLGNVWQGERSWNKVMGEGTRMTDSALATYDQRQREYINDNMDTLGPKIEEQAAYNSSMSAYARAYDAGIETELDDYFEQIWEGGINGFSEHKLRANLESYKASKEGLANGTRTAGSIVGGGYKNPKRVANEWLDRVIAEGEEDIRTRGRSNDLNVSNARYRHREDNSGI